MILLQVALCLTGLVLVVEMYSSTSWTREILHRTKRQGRTECQYDEFRCRSGECIDAFTVCDGTKECADGSDETETTCKPLNIIDPLIPVPSRGCPLPQKLEFGNFTAPTCGLDEKSALCRLVPGTPAPENWILSFKCDEGYYIKDTRDGNFNAFCDNGEWSPKIPVCRKMCSPLLSLNVAIRCFNEEGDVDCSYPMDPGTRAEGECKPSYTQTRSPLYREIICKVNGQWSSELFNCQPDEIKTQPCNPSPCGPFSQCRDVNGQAVCSCVPGYMGFPPACRPECVVNTDCNLNQACFNQRCRDPCPGTCGVNARCQVINHNPICSCLSAYTGDPFTRCQPIPQALSPANPCQPTPCGPYSQCKASGDSPSCSCLPEYIGMPPNCRPECVSNSECASHLACVNQKCKDPCPGICGINAECHVVSHTTQCVCSSGFTGDPFRQCSLLPEPVIDERPTMEQMLNKCLPSPCGTNAVCREQNKAGSCTCLPDYVGNPYEGCRPKCVLNTDCPSDKVCIRNKCQDPCPGTCGQNAECHVVNHLPLCTCHPGYTGNPFKYCTIQPTQDIPVPSPAEPCKPSPCGPNSQCRVVKDQAVCSCLTSYIGSPPACRECLVSAECSLNNACINQKCSDPCPGTRGINTHCEVINHSPICSCKHGFTGDPSSRCSPILNEPTSTKPAPPVMPCIPSPCGPHSICQPVGNIPSCSCLPSYLGSPPNCHPDSSINSDCKSNLASIREKCRDPCPGSCGVGAQCNVINNTTVCTCPPHYTGDPFTNCYPEPPQAAPPEPMDLCNPSPCGPNTQCREGVCTCLPEYQGDPYSGCRPECVLNTDCPKDKACMRNKCNDPCPGTCGQNARCDVINHNPVCSCPEKMSGNPFVQCRPVQDEIITQPCNPSPCGPFSQCRDVNGQAVCSCAPGYMGSPPACRPECVVNTDCNLNQACYNQRCRDPCPVCGKRNRQGASKPLVTNGSPTKYSEFPWHVGIYQRNASSQWEQTCGGSLISPHTVLTAAHCVFSEQQKAVLPPNEFKVGLGKYYREWTHDEPHAVKADVRTILISPLYKGQATSYAYDVALIDLTESIQVSASIMPVCVDWQHEFTISPGVIGTLAGWGRTENVTPSDVLLYADLSYIDYRHCIDEIPQLFRHYVTSDKFCASFRNGAGAASVDSGGGLMFVRDDLHYVHGIVSNNLKGSKSFAILTDITDKTLLGWLNSAKDTLEEAHPETNQFTCTSGEYIDIFSACDGSKDCEDGSDETETACLNIVCPSFAFQCAYGACIAKSERCNGQVGCADGSDEADCIVAARPPPPPITTRRPPPSPVFTRPPTPAFTRPPTYPTRPPTLRPTIPSPLTTTRPTTTTELHLTTPRPDFSFVPSKCKGTEFECASGQCIDKYIVCDGRVDCGDGSDETVSQCLSVSCSPGTYQCAYGACIADEERCNGQVDCSDGSDEADCHEPTRPYLPPPNQQAPPLRPPFPPTRPDSYSPVPVHAPVSLICKETEFKCRSGHCVDKLFLCDGRVDCADGSDETVSQCSSVSCPKSKFPCAYGACIDINKKCDGHRDCADGSDEVVPACPGPAFSKPKYHSQQQSISFTASGGHSVSLKCKETEFECVSGECIDKLFVCDGSEDCEDGSDETASQCFRVRLLSSQPPQTGGCRLPPMPEFGTYAGAVCAFDNRTAGCRQEPGTPVPENWALSFKCSEGYYIMETEDENSYAFCVSGRWSPKIPFCRKMCSPLLSLSVAVRCYKGEDDVDCSKPMRPGTRAKGECKPSYTQIRPPPYTEIICRENGQWSYELFYCQPVCGKRNIQGVNKPLILDGSVALYGEFPWHAGLYLMNESNQWEQKCGGTLISPHIILSAAHCVFSEQIKAKLPPEAIKVGLGKYYREWTHDEAYAVQTDVRKILIPSRYYGYATSYTHDIALLDLIDSVQVHATIMPVCVDWKREFTITPGTVGTLAGWGKTEGGTPSDVLLYADLPFVDYHHCINNVPQVFQHYVTTDKFCAGFTDGAGAAKGDSGGGLTFVQDDLHYVYGIVSTKVKKAKSFITFTNVSNVELFMWLNHAKRIFDEAHKET